METTKITPFQVGDRVHIDEYVPRWLVGFPSNVNGTINKVAGVTYGIDVDDDKYYAWYPHSCLTKIEETTMDQFPEQAHVRLHVAGSSTKIEMFHYILAKLDPDWPWRPDNHYDPNTQCAVCQGYIYPNPTINADGLRALAKQVDATNRASGGLKLKIKKFNVQARCKANEPDLDPPDPEPPVATGLLEINPIPDIASYEGMVD